MFRFLPSDVPSNLPASSKLHCCWVALGSTHACMVALLPTFSVAPPSTHMPAGLPGVRDATSTRFRFPLYAHFCCGLPATHGCTTTLVPAAGELDPASRHSSFALL